MQEEDRGTAGSAHGVPSLLRSSHSSCLAALLAASFCTGYERCVWSIVFFFTDLGETPAIKGILDWAGWGLLAETERYLADRQIGQGWSGGK